MNSKIIFILTLALLLAPLTLQASQVSVTVNGHVVNFENQPPAIIEGRTLVPVREVFEQLSFNVVWDGSTQTVTLLKDSNIVGVTIGSDTFTRNGVDHVLDVPAQIINGSTMLPIAALLRSVGYNVDWDGETSTVMITSTASMQYVNFTETFAEHFDLQQLRDVLGVDFTIQEEQHRNGSGTIRWHHIDLQGEIDLRRFNLTDNTMGLGLPQGGAALVNRNDQSRRNEWSVFINHNGRNNVTKIHLFLSDNNVDESEFPFDMDYVREVLGTNFDIRQERILALGVQEVSWNMLALHKQLSRDQMLEVLAINRQGEYDSEFNNIWHTQLGDVFFRQSRGEWFLFVDVGPAPGGNNIRRGVTSNNVGQNTFGHNLEDSTRGAVLREYRRIGLE